MGQDENGIIGYCRNCGLPLYTNRDDSSWVGQPDPDHGEMVYHCLPCHEARFPGSVCLDYRTLADDGISLDDGA